MTDNPCAPLDHSLSTAIERLAEAIKRRPNEPSTHTVRTQTQLEERLKSVSDKVDVAHARIDKHVELTREFHEKVYEAIENVRKDIRTSTAPITEWMNQGKGGMAALLAAGGIIGFLATMLWNQIIGRSP